MRKNYLFLVTAAMVMASCANDDFLGEDATAQDGKQAIEFNMSTPAMTRGDYDHETSAGKLNNEFIVWGEKNESGATDEANGNLVFKNYRVQYVASSANSTTSNTKDWEYVGITPYAANVTPSVTTTQTIKYWDFKTPYTFTAVSAKSTDITSGLVKITKNSEKTNELEKGYTIELGENASVGDIYVSDRKVVEKTGKGTTAADDAVQLKFRNFQSKIRFGIYETVPGYKAVITGIDYTGTETTGTNGKFGIKGNFIKAGTNTKYTVTYSAATGTDDNKAKVEFSTTDTPAADTYLQTDGTTWLNTTKDAPVGTAANAPTWDNYDTTNNTGVYKAILPNPSNTTNLTLKVRFDLYSEDTGEKIECEAKEVQVPAEYCQWKSNYAYTYLFKITDKSADLYPITFDAVVVQDEYTGTQETITSVSEPSITTFGVSGGKYVSGKDEYAANDVIYATVLDNGEVPVLTAGAAANGVNLYIITTDYTDKTVITEGAVENLIAHTTETSGVRTLTDANKKEWKATKQTIAAADLVTEVPTEDGNKVKLNTAGTATALKWTAGTTGTYYAVEYVKSSTEKYYKIVKIQ